MLGHDFTGFNYLRFLCCNLEHTVNEMPVESAASVSPPPPFNHLIPTVWHIYNVHTHTHLLLRGQRKGPLPVGGQRVLKSAS